MARQRRLDPFPPLAPALQGRRPGGEAQAPAAQGAQLRHHGFDAGPVIDLDRGGMALGGGAVDQHHRPVRRDRAQYPLVIEAGAANDQAVDALVEQHAEHLLLALLRGARWSQATGALLTSAVAAERPSRR